MRHIKKIGVAAFLFATVDAAASQDRYFLEQDVPLWGELITGMSKKEVKTLNLNEKFDLSEDCRVKLKNRFRSDRLYSVKISARWDRSYNQCGELVNRSLIANYGDSVDTAAKTDSYAPMRGTYLEKQWLTDKLIITLGYGPDSGRFYYVNYEPRLVREDAELLDNL